MGVLGWSLLLLKSVEIEICILSPELYGWNTPKGHFATDWCVHEMHNIIKEVDWLQRGSVNSVITYIDAVTTFCLLCSHHNKPAQLSTFRLHHQVFVNRGNLLYSLDSCCVIKQLMPLFKLKQVTFGKMFCWESFSVSSGSELNHTRQCR